MLLFRVLALLLVFFVVLYLVFLRVFSVNRQRTRMADRLPSNLHYQGFEQQCICLIHAALAIPFQEVSIESFDGSRLYGRYYETRPGAPLQILFHGYRSNAIRDFSGGLRLALDSGCNVLLVDQRAHGNSDAHFLTFGIRERRDCLCWARYAEQRFGSQVPIILTGISMGAATVLMASELELPQNTAGIIADCGYSSPEAIIRKVMRDLHYPQALCFPLVKAAAQVYGHFDISECSAASALKHCRIPVLFIHGEGDTFVPMEMSRVNYAACAAPKTIFTVPHAEHGISYLHDTAGYSAHVRQFLKEVCPDYPFGW